MRYDKRDDPQMVGPPAHPPTMLTRGILQLKMRGSASAPTAHAHPRQSTCPICRVFAKPKHPARARAQAVMLKLVETIFNDPGTRNALRGMYMATPDYLTGGAEGGWGGRQGLSKARPCGADHVGLTRCAAAPSQLWLQQRAH